MKSLVRKTLQFSYSGVWLIVGISQSDGIVLLKAVRKSVLKTPDAAGVYMINNSAEDVWYNNSRPIIS